MVLCDCMDADCPTANCIRDRLLEFLLNDAPASAACGAVAARSFEA